MAEHDDRDHGRGGGRPGRRGNSLIQTAIVMQVLLAVVLGIVEFGQYLYVKHAFAAAARDAARVASLETSTQGSVVAQATATLAGANVAMTPAWFQAYDVSADGATVTAVSDVSAIPPGHRVQVTVGTTYDQIPNAMRFLYTVLGKGIGPNKPIAGTCTMVRE